MKQMAMVICICILLCFPISTVTSYNLQDNSVHHSAVEDDIELYIWGGLYLLLSQDNVNESPIGFIIRVVNNRDDWIHGNLSIRIRYFNNDWSVNPSFDVCPHSERSCHFVFKYSFALLTVKLTEENKTLIRSGFMIMGFTVFLTRSEIEHSGGTSKAMEIQDRNRYNIGCFLPDDHSSSLL
ncbi:MAG: hypothetical protein U9O96_07325 [Candidatus Thermoplasmatota archaeon]|nr:hypothetical protein [Candidatus Thermoplasmatota archaeon]